MIERFIESRKLFDLLAKEHHHLARELNLPQYQTAKIARRLGVSTKMLGERLSGTIASCPATLTSLFANELGADIQLVTAEAKTEYTDESCRAGFHKINQMRLDMVRNGNKEVTLDRVAPQMGLTRSHLSQLKNRVLTISLDSLVLFAEIIDVSVYAEVTHDFRSAQE